MSDANTPNVSYEVMAVTALARAQKFEQVLAAAPEKARLCREAWRVFGQTLNELRAQYSSRKLFGQAVKRLGLDAPPADSSAIRSDAMWLASVWTRLQGCKMELGSSHNPRAIRNLCRARGLSWASNARDVTPKPKRAPSAYRRLESAKSMRLTPDQSALLDAGIAPEREAPALSVSMRERFDKAVERVTHALHVEYQKQFDAAVSAECDRRMPDEINKARKRAQESLRHSQNALNDWIRRRDAIPNPMTHEQWRLVSDCLNPDSAPDDRRERFSKAFAAWNRLESCLRD